jgi:hypothetical protein
MTAIEGFLSLMREASSSREIRGRVVMFSWVEEDMIGGLEGVGCWRM